MCHMVNVKNDAMVDVQNEDLAYRFNVSPATISRVMKWLKRMDMRLLGLIF